jgi:hypothetical protein
MSQSSNFFVGQPAFKQIVNLVDKNTVYRLAREYGTDRYVKKLCTYKHLLAMLYGILSDCNSLRELTLGSLVNADRLSHLGIDFKICRSTLSDSNAKRGSLVFGALYSEIYRQNRHYLSDSRLAAWRPVKNLFAFDSTTITLFSDVLKGCDKEYEKGSRQGKRKGGIKSHAMIKVSEGVPCLVRLSAAAVADGNYMKELKNLEKGSMVAIDRAYCYHSVFEELSERGIFYTTRLKDIVKYEVDKVFFHEDKAEGILRDERVLLSIPKKACMGKEKHEARRVEYIDQNDKKKYVLLTNNFKLKASTIAKIYKKRWSIETMFKRIKQNFQLKYFYGDNANAVETQVWCVLIACLLMTVFKSMHKIKLSFSSMMFVTRFALMAYIWLSKVLLAPEKTLEKMLEKQNPAQAPPSLFE